MNNLGSFLVDAISIGSIVGIWPRYIEPRLLKKSYLKWSLAPEHRALRGFKIVHFTDLHFHAASDLKFLSKVKKTLLDEKADIIVFTGDFLCYALLEKQEILKEFLSSLKAPKGCYCVFGNHDYASYVSRDMFGNYVVKKQINPLQGIYRGLKILCTKKNPKKGIVSVEAKKTLNHASLCRLLQDCQFQILENQTITLPNGLNIVGLGEYSLGKCQPEIAFKNYKKECPGLILVHNPDAAIDLLNYPGDLILAGHTHGEQIHIALPLLRELSKKLLRVENPQYSRGLYQLEGKKLYINRGIGCHKPFRLGSIPEILVVTIDA